MMRPVMVRADQNEVVELGEPAVLPVHEVMGVQTTGGPAAGHHAAAVAVLQDAAQPAVDGAGRPPGPDHPAVAFEPHLAGGITAQVAAVVIGEQRPQMQGGDPAFEVDVHDDGGALRVRATSHLGVPAGDDQAHEPVDGVRQRRRWTRMRRRGGRVSTRRSAHRDETARAASNVAASACGSVIRQVLDCSSPVLLIERLRFRPRLGFGSRFQFDRGAQLADRGALRPSARSARRIRRRPSRRSRRPDPARTGLPASPSRSAGNSSIRCATAAMVSALRSDTPVIQATNDGIERAPVAPQIPSRSISATIVHDLPVDGVALTGQLRHLLQQRIHTLSRARPGSETGSPLLLLAPRPLERQPPRVRCDQLVDGVGAPGARRVDLHRRRIVQQRSRTLPQ